MSDNEGQDGHVETDSQRVGMPEQRLLQSSRRAKYLALEVPGSGARQTWLLSTMIER